MRALFWMFPSILMIGKKGEMIRRSKAELGEIALKMWADAKVGRDINDENLMSIIRRPFPLSPTTEILTIFCSTC